MISEPALQAVMTARHGAPFDVLGLHADDDGRLWVRAVLPRARAVDVVDAKSGRALVSMVMRHGEGFWEAVVPRRRQAFAYRLRVEWDTGEQGVYADAYAFGPGITDADLYYLSEGTHLRPYEVLGAHPAVRHDGFEDVAGVRFAVWAPNAKRVSVVGEFNVWDGRRHPMRVHRPAGVWELFVPHAGIGDRYKFEIVGPDGQLVPLKADPYARAAQLRPETASIVSPMPPRKALPAARAGRNDRFAPVSIYEVHLGSWMRREDGGFLTWDELGEALPPYAAKLGFTHLELMPITEFPFDGSWGYQTLGLYAPTARFGPPEAFARFVDTCHAHGLGLLLDWVPAHFPVDAHGLARFDGSPLFEYADPREGFHRDWNTAIYNFGRHEVRNFLVGSALYWVERYAVDGLRVDAVASMLYRDYSRPSGEWLPNAYGGRENLEAIDFLKRTNEVLGNECPSAITVAEESTAFPGVSMPTYAGGLGFHYKWNMGWMHDSLQYMAQDPVHRRWHHDRMTFSLAYAFTEKFVLPLSHDEVVHGKGSILSRMPGDAWQKFANLRAYYAFMWGHPGKKLMFMGQEFAQPAEWNHDETLPWHLLDDPAHGGVQRLVADLNALYRDQPALHRLDGSPAGFEWIDAADAENSIFAWVRRDDLGRQLIVVSNMTPLPRPGYRLGVPSEAGTTGWREVLNTDAKIYGGSDVGNAGGLLPCEDVGAQGRSRSIQLTLPPLATLYLVPA
jgi:1,4-alpha-glucan branching enzyme